MELPGLNPIHPLLERNKIVDKMLKHDQWITLHDQVRHISNNFRGNYFHSYDQYYRRRHNGLQQKITQLQCSWWCKPEISSFIQDWFKTPFGKSNFKMRICWHYNTLDRTRCETIQITICNESLEIHLFSPCSSNQTFTCMNCKFVLVYNQILGFRITLSMATKLTRSVNCSSFTYTRQNYHTQTTKLNSA